MKKHIKSITFYWSYSVTDGPLGLYAGLNFFKVNAQMSSILTSLELFPLGLHPAIQIL